MITTTLSHFVALIVVLSPAAHHPPGEWINVGPWSSISVVISRLPAFYYRQEALANKLSNPLYGTASYME
ncbi:hypothetical protein AB4Z29_07425 [Paenibacillus sp. 2TAB23]|uniref:hypothetical protein n=1 Tax=Paenibacillus sp. 2TAB23 TaxID=3233004 RepID=UPI003F983F2E